MTRSKDKGNPAPAPACVCRQCPACIARTYSAHRVRTDPIVPPRSNKPFRGPAALSHLTPGQGNG